MKQIYLLIAFSALLLSTSFSTDRFEEAGTSNRSLVIKTVVIDPGHGGKDPGCLGRTKTYESHIALAIALKLGSYIERYFPEVEVIYTRKTDIFVPLIERANIANRNKANLFISIHCNASESSTRCERC